MEIQGRGRKLSPEVKRKGVVNKGNLIALPPKMPGSSLQCLIKEKTRGEKKTLECESYCAQVGFKGVTALKLNVSTEDASLLTANFFKRK